MGADFNYALCAKITDRETAEKRILSLSNERILEISSDLCDDNDIYDMEESVAAVTYRGRLLSDLDYVYGDRRDVGALILDGKNYVLTGGMSWGDDPTEAYWPLARIAETAATDTEENFMLNNNLKAGQ